ncbi:hypothetical protein SAMN04488040_2211 [Sulfitobacter marinus]|uniref:EF-hand domain-containing protein n=1 Tax=Sulfitobacter marinus TaxID=394264 RepID=A0A1I6TEV3_9RHOB|nr:hypothetical protein [Sulfitobacter marinus]SFS87638.1 hypothetical protein SAMN04488040_2211 [Sulfitobacter marinus]
MRQLFLFLFSGMIGSSVLAEPMLVRSGEHGGFTRVVIDAGQKATWSAKHSGKLVEVSVKGPENSFNLAQLYNRITRERVQSADQSDGILLLELDCDCSVSIFDSPPGMIVVDIASPDVELTTPLLAKAPNPVDVPNDPIEPKPSKEKELVKALPPSNDILAGLSMRSESTAIFQAAIAHDIGSLGTQGILKKSVPIGPEAGLKKVPPLTLDLSKNPLSEFRNVKIGSSLEEKLTQQNDAGTAECGDTETLANLGEAIVTGDFAKYQDPNTVIDPQQQEDTVRILDYLHNGLGAEAAQLIPYYTGNDAEISFLKMVSDLFEYGQSDKVDQVSSQLNCAPSLKIWALATYKGSGSDLTEEGIKDSLLSFSKFPRHLRNIIHPLLEESIDNIRKGKSSNAASNQLAASFPDFLKTLSMNAEKSDFTDIFSNNFSQKEDSTPTVSKTTKSLALAVEDKIGKGQPATLQEMKVIDMEVFDAADTDDEGRLTALKLSALLSRGEFYSAYDLLGQQKSKDVVLVERMANTMFDSLATRASDVELLELAMPIEERFRSLLDPQTIDKISARQNSIMASIGVASAPNLGTSNTRETRDQADAVVSPAFNTGPFAELASQNNSASRDINVPTAEETLNSAQEFRDSLEKLIR